LAVTCFGGAGLFAQRHAGKPALPAAQIIPLGESGEAAGIPETQLRSLAMVSADFDQDGVTDLAIGYALAQGGAIEVMRGNLDAIAPRTEASWLAAGRHELAKPFLPPTEMIRLAARPDLLIAADVNGDGYLDLVYAARGSSKLQVLFGASKGRFLPSPVSVELPGKISALAAYRPGGTMLGEALLAGYQTKQGAGLAIVSLDRTGLAVRATYELPAAPTALTVANLDEDFIPDTAIVAGGKLLVLHGRNAIEGHGRLETLPVSGVESVAAGEFIFDRHTVLQLGVLTADGDVLILAHEGLDSRPYRPEEIKEARRAQRLHPGSPSLAEQAGNTGAEPWTVVETDAQAGVHSASSSVPILLRSRISGSGGDDLVVLNPAEQQRVIIRHSGGVSPDAVSAASRIVTGSLGSSRVVGAASVRVNADGRPGLAVVTEGSVHPEFTVPSPGNTFYVNTSSDNTGTATDNDDGTRCTQGASDICTLRDAVTFANADAADNINGGKSDTVMLPGGTYSLSWQAGTLDTNGSAMTHLEILGPVTIVGNARDSVIDATGNDVVFTINPGPYGSFNLSGDSYVFDTTLESLVIENGKNPNNPNVNPSSNNVGGGINWDAFGTGNLGLTNDTIGTNSVLYGPGGGIWAENSVGGGTGSLTITNSTISSNSSPEEGGGIYIADPPAAFSAVNSTISSNLTSPSVNTNDPSGLGEGGGIYVTARTGSPASPQSTIANSTINGNSGAAEGGGIYTSSGLLIGTSTVSSNTSGQLGGGIFAVEVSPEASTTITSANILNNTATSSGGGIYVGAGNPAGSDSLVMSLSRIHGNGSTSGTGGLGVDSPGLAMATDNWWGCNAGPANASCDEADSGATTSPWAVFALNENSSTVQLNQNLELNVSLNTDSNGNAITGAFPAVAGDSFTFDVTGVTISSPLTGGDFNGAGAGSATLTPTSAGNGMVQATFDNQTVSVNFTALGLDHFAVSAPATAVAGNLFSVTVTAEDSDNNVFTGYTGIVQFTSSDLAAVLPANSTLTNGVGTFTVTLKTAGTQTVSVQDTVTTTVTGTSGAINVSAAAATHFNVVAPTPVVSFINNTLTVTALDQFNNVATGYTGVVHLTSTDAGFVNASGDGPLVNGVGTFNFGLKTAGTQTITATDTVNASITGTSNQITVLPGPTTRFSVVAPATATAASPITFIVTALDLFGNVTPAYTGTVQFTSTDPNATLPASYTFVSANAGVQTTIATLYTAGNQTITATDTVNAAITGTSGNIFVTVPTFAVTNIADSGPGSLRQALFDAGSAGAGNITFASVPFSSPQTITLASGLTIPAYTSITGPATGSGATLMNLVTVAGGGPSSSFSVFTVNSGTVGTSISGLTITGGNSTQGGGINNSGALTVSNSTISGNTASVNDGSAQGSGIFNNGTLTVNSSTISGNSVTAIGTSGTLAAFGAGIYNTGTLNVTNSTIAGNSATATGTGCIDIEGCSSTAFGGGIWNDSILTLVNTTITGNSVSGTEVAGQFGSAGGGGIYQVGSSASLANTIVSDNTGATDPDIFGAYTDNLGNLVGSTTPGLAPLGNYGGATQTVLPLPGSPAICNGTLANAASLSADQRGFARTTTYTGIGACVDAGAVQTGYTSAQFKSSPLSGIINQPVSPAPVASVTENGQNIGGVPITLIFRGTGTATGLGPVTTIAGAGATFPNVKVNATSASDTLQVILPITATGNPVQPNPLTALAPLLINPVPTTTTLTSNANPSVFGQSVTFTATVTETGESGIPTGSVIFSVDGTNTSISTLNAGGQATFTYSGLSVAMHSIKATYGGDTNNASSNSGTLTQVVNKASTTISVQSSVNPTPYGSALTFTATVAAVAPGAGAPTGSVVFMDGSTTLGTVSLTPGASSSTASFSSSALAAGMHSITVEYGGSTDFNSSLSLALTENVTPATTTTTLASNVNPSVFGQAVMFTATVTSQGGTPTGSVTFTVDSGAPSPANLNGSGQATFTTSALSVGTHSIVASYGATNNFQTSSSSPVSQAVNKASTTTSLGSSLNPSTFGTSVTFTATVTAIAPGAGTPAGTVTFLSGTTAIGTGTLNGSGVATLAISSLAVGTQSITASYAGSASFNGSTSTMLSQVVNQDPTATALASNANPSVFGQPVTFTATVTSGSSPVTTGSVTFSVDSTASAPVTLNSAGQATFNTSALSVGTHTIAASYGGATNFATSSASVLSQVVNKAPTTTGLTSSLNPSTLGTSVTFTATVTANSPSTGTPAGTVAFLNGTTSIGTGTLNNSGVATLSISSLAVGTQSITASYAGSTSFNSSTSTMLSQVVNLDPQTITFTAPPSPVTYGVAPITLSATGGGSGNAVTFSVVSGPGSISSNMLSITGVGTVVVAANQLGNTNYAAAPQVTRSVVVQPAVLTVTPSTKQVTYGEAIPTLTAYTLSGFVNGDTAAVVSGAPLLSTTATSTSPAGTYSITGTLNTLSAANYTFVINPGVLIVAKAKLLVTANNLTMVAGATVPALTYTITGFVNGDTQVSATSGQPVLSTTVTSSTPPGKYYVIAVERGTLMAANYVFAPVDGILVVTKAPSSQAQWISFRPPAAVRYGDTINLADFAQASSGLPVSFKLVSGPGSLSGSMLAFTGVGSVVVEATVPSNVTYAPATATQTITVNPAVLSVVVGDRQLTYGETIPTFTSYTLTGFVNGDTSAVVSGAAVLGTTATSKSPAGIYAITANVSGLSAANYTFHVDAGVLNIVPAKLLLTAANQTMVEGAAVPTLTYTITGFLNGDTQASATSGQPTLSTTATSSSRPGTYIIDVQRGTLTAANYVFGTVNGVLTVTR
jgi:hypothetical protein